MLNRPASQYAQSAEWYDRIYAGAGKDYRAEAEVVDGIIRTRNPAASSLLDVGCGTGLHLEQFAQLYDVVAGIDLEPQFVERARKRCVGSRVEVGDMCAFDLTRTFDAVTCMFSAIGHVGGAAELKTAVEAMARHLTVGGVLVVEPWISSDVWRDGTFGVEIAESPDATLVRAGHSTSDGRVSLLNFAWVETSSTGITRMDEQLRLTRFTADEFEAAFASAGLTATFDARGCNDGGRGLWIAVRDH